MIVCCVDNRQYLSYDEEHGRFVQRPGADPLLSITLGRTYAVLAEEQGYYRIIDDTGEDYLYPAYMFEPAS